MDAKITKKLQEELDGSLISLKRGRYRYIEGCTVIDQANGIFGHGGWGYELASPVEMRTFDVVDKKTGEKRTQYGYSATVTVTVKDAQPRTDIGFCTVADQTADGHDTAMKGAVTDGLKRALRTFGNQFGNCLYDNTWKPAGQAQPAQHRNGRTPAPARGGQAKSTKDIATATMMKRIDQLSKTVFGPALWETKRDKAIQARTDGKRPLTKAEAKEMIANLERLESQPEEVELQ